MTVMIAGLLLFLGLHSVRIFGEGLRTASIARFGETAYKAVYSLVSLAGLVLVGQGYGEALADGGMVWDPPAATRHLSLLLVPAAFVLVVAAYVPTGRIKAFVGHPMVLGIGLWALGHLLANGETANVVLFGAFLVWAAFDYAASLARDRRMGTVRRSLGARGDILAITVGLGAALVFIWRLHLWLIGVTPLG
ncbi:NnrU family protein [Aureimonas sp. SA4125]|uniref:NnrU family protein n=1 Tax=Aureimonas sp. SA4125 TaxID=2826993 RepID=UPI001CC4CDB8|nr:NnrU family protein [Aureimonas sp. SA4125]